MTMPNLQGSTPQGGGPTLRCFGVGRAVLIMPKEEKMGTAFDGKDPKPYIECNVVALPDQRSAPFITFGGEVLQDGVTVKVPDTHRVDLGPHGWMAENVKISGGGMLYILRAAMRSGSARVGRLFKDPAYNNAWKLTDPDKEHGGSYEPELMAQAHWWLGLYASHAFTNVYPVPINVVPAQAAPQQSAAWNVMEQGAAGYQAPQQQPPAQSWPTNPAPAQQPAPQGWGAPAQQAPQPAYAGPPAAPAQQQAPQGWGAPQQVAPAAPQSWGTPPAQGDPNAQAPHPGF